MKKMITLVLMVLFALTPCLACAAPQAAAPAEQPAAAAEQVAPAETAVPIEQVETVTEERKVDEGEFAIEKVDGVKIAWFSALVHDYFEVILEGAKTFSDEYGVELNAVYGDGTQDVATQKIEALVAQGYKDLVIYPIDGAASNNLYEEICATGAKVVNYGMSADYPTPASFFVGTSAYNTTIYQLEQMNEMMGGNGGSVMIVMEQIQSPYMRKAMEAIDAYTAEHPEFVVAQLVGDIITSEEAVTKISDAFSVNLGNINGLVTIGATCATGLARVYEEVYATNPDQKHIFTITNDCDTEVAAAIEKGYIDVALYEPTFAMGYVAAALSYLLATGYEPINDDYYVYIDNTVITKDNVATYSADKETYAKSLITTLDQYVQKAE